MGSFAGNADYQGVMSQEVAFTIAPPTTANLATPIVHVVLPAGSTSNSYTYTGVAPVVTATVAGTIANVDNTQTASLEGVTPSLVFRDINGNALTGAPTDAGTYTIVGTFAGSADYKTANASVTFTIAKATPTLTVTSVTVPYDGSSNGRHRVRYGCGRSGAANLQPDLFLGHYHAEQPAGERR